MKKALFIAFMCLTITGVFITVMGYMWWTNELKAPSTSAQTHEVLITKGSNAEQIAKKLHEAGVIKNELVFRLYTKLTKKAASLPVGEFLVPGNLSVSEVIAFLQKGPQEVWVTFPEGLRREQFPERVSAAVGHTEAQARAFRTTFLELTEISEGYLFPETYLVPKEISAEKMIALLKNTFEKKFPNSTKAQVILASVVERETRNDSEKPIIAGILQNRIAIGMPLQVDATVQYVKANISCSDNGYPCEEWWPTVYLDDYKLKSSFNTYVIAGLPPAPIANPGLASLKAAANPETSQYLYYIHDTSGGIHYAKTYDEHLANVQKYLR